MNRISVRTLVGLTVLVAATLAVLHAAGTTQPETRLNPEDGLSTRVPSTPDDGADKTAKRKNLLIIGASSLTSPVAQTDLVGAMLESKQIHMNIEGRFPELDAVPEMLGSNHHWDYVVIDTWHLGRGSADGSQGNASVPPDFPKAVALFVKQVRAHSPKCNIILFPWWIPRGPTATNEGVMEVFRRCVQEARLNNIWVATTGPAFMEARLGRPDLHITKSKTDGHPGDHGAYINACSLFVIISDRSPLGLPATLRIKATGGAERDFAIAPNDAKYLQELAWKVYRREIRNSKPAESDKNS